MRRQKPRANGRCSVVGATLAALCLLYPSAARAQLSCDQGFTRLELSHTGSVQEVQLGPDATTLIVRAIGAGGGSVDTKPGGAGALIQGTFAVAGGEVLQILVGGRGSSPAFGNGGGGGGGGSLVGIGASLGSVSPLVIAGGGGGAGRGDGADGGPGGVPGPTTPPSGTVGGGGGTAGGDGGAGDQNAADGEPGAVGGSAGEGGASTPGCLAGGGAGLNSDGGATTQVSAAIALLSGGDGGTNLAVPTFFGGFGGGGAPSNCGGGGGGYSGGGAGGDGDFGNATTGGGGGGGSLNNGSDVLNIAAFNGADTDGLVELCANGQAPVPTMPFWLLVVLCLMLVAAGRLAVAKRTRLAPALLAASLALAGCYTSRPVIDPSTKPPTQEGTVAGHVRTSTNTPVVGRIVRAVPLEGDAQAYETTTSNTGGYTMKVKPGRYRLEVALIQGEKLEKQPGETRIDASDLDPGQDFVIALER